MPSYEDLAAKQVELIRKALAESVFVADMTAVLVAAKTTGLWAIPLVTECFGFVTGWPSPMIIHGRRTSGASRNRSMSRFPGKSPRRP